MCELADPVPLFGGYVALNDYLFQETSLCLLSVSYLFVKCLWQWFSK